MRRRQSWYAQSDVRDTAFAPMTDQASNHTADSGAREPSTRRRLRLPHVDFVTLMLVVLFLFIVLFLTAELWMPHLPD